MSPGWYNDPSVYGGLRWWDGSQWTPHATPPEAAQPSAAHPYTAHPYAAQQYLPATSSRRFSAGKVVLAVVGFFIVVPVIAAIAIPVFLNHSSSSPSCGTEAPAGASEQTKAYVTLVHENYRQLAAYTRYVNEHGGGNHQGTTTEYTMYRKAEDDFVRGLAAIQFTGKAAVDVRDVLARSRALVADLDELISRPTQAAHNRLQADFAVARADVLRTDL